MHNLGRRHAEDRGAEELPAFFSSTSTFIEPCVLAGFSRPPTCFYLHLAYSTLRALALLRLGFVMPVAPERRIDETHRS